MKKILVLLLTASMIAAIFMGCAEKFGSSSADTNGNGLRDDVEWDIMKARDGKNAIPSDFDIEYYGTYNDAVVVLVTHKRAYYAQLAWDETIAGEKFSYPSSNGIVVWYKGSFLKLAEAYESHILADGDIETIYNIHSSK